MKLVILTSHLRRVRNSTAQRQVSSWLVASAVVLGATWGAAAPGAIPTPSTSASTTSIAPTGSIGTERGGPALLGSLPLRGLSPLPAGSAVTLGYLPPGASFPDVGPSQAIYPPQKIPLRFTHKRHSQDLKIACITCHRDAATSTVSSDVLLPKRHEVCQSCHAIDEKQPEKAGSGTPTARCDGCHLGVNTLTLGGVTTTTVAKLVIPAPNLRFSHKAHVANTCVSCHGDVGGLDLATRDQLPRMKGCLTCHNQVAATSPTTKTASGACTTCHISTAAGTLRTMFPTGALMPPRWLKNAEHGSDWAERHKKVAGLDSQFCANCHVESECNACHNARVKPKSAHPGDYLTIHGIDARFDAPKCQSCHATTSFCTPCHVRAGVSPSGPSAIATTMRFHPPASLWSGSTRGMGHHANEAQKNITACVSCHVERDCVSCHATTRVGGAGAKTHGPSFVSSCNVAFAKNPRPCFVCHTPGDRVLASCR